MPADARTKPLNLPTWVRGLDEVQASLQRPSRLWQVSKRFEDADASWGLWRPSGEP